jgi:hypothetical protein
LCVFSDREVVPEVTVTQCNLQFLFARCKAIHIFALKSSKTMANQDNHYFDKLFLSKDAPVSDVTKPPYVEMKHYLVGNYKSLSM